MSLFAFFGIWQVAAGLGIGAVAIPVVIHLLNRRRFVIIDWAAMRFLLAAQKQNSKRLRIEQLLLLLIRILMLLGLVVAMSAVMPWAENIWATIWPDGAGKLQTKIGRTHHVLVVDASLSMNVAVDDDKTLFDRAKEHMLAKVKKALPGDFFSILVLKENPTWLTAAPSPYFNKVSDEINALKASHGNTSSATALTMIAAKLGEFHPRFPNQSVYVFTDLQRSSWDQGKPAESSPDKGGEDEPRKGPRLEDIQKLGAQVIFVDVVPETILTSAGKDQPGFIDNLAVTNLELQDPVVIAGARAELLVTVQYFGMGVKQARLVVGQAPAPLANSGAPFQLIEAPAKDPSGKAIEINLLGMQSVTHRIALTFAQAGSYAVQVKLQSMKGEQSPDRLPEDNVRSLAIQVRDPVPVLLVNGQGTDKDSFTSATRFLQNALHPMEKGSALARILPTTVNSLADVAEDQWEKYDCIFLVDVPAQRADPLNPGSKIPELSEAIVKKLEAHVRRGGGLVISMGDRSATTLEEYNTLFYKDGQGLLPALFEAKISAPDKHHFYIDPESDEEFRVAPLRSFRDDLDRIWLAQIFFDKYVQVKLPRETHVHKILRFIPEPSVPGEMLDEKVPTGDPAILEWNPPTGRSSTKPVRVRGRAVPANPPMKGKVVLITTALNRDWSDWPAGPIEKNGSYLAMMQEITRLAVSGLLRHQAGTVGTALEDVFPGAGGEMDTVLYLPDGEVKKSRTQYLDETNVFRSSDTDRSGIYRLSLANLPREYLYAFNVPTAPVDGRGLESDLYRLARADLETLLRGLDLQIVQSLDEIIYRQNENSMIIEERAPVGPVIARYVLWFVLLLVFLEVVLGYVFGHHTTTSEAVQPQPTQWFWPVAAVVLAVVVALPIGWVLWDEQNTGKFLSFLPEDGRAWIEKNFGIADPESGESSEWALGRQTIFLGPGRDGFLLAGLFFFGIVLILGMYRLEARRAPLLYCLFCSVLAMLFLCLLMFVWMPQLDWRFNRLGWPDLVLIMDTSQSMGEADAYRDEKTRDKAKALGDKMRDLVKARLPEKLRETEAELRFAQENAPGNPALAGEAQELAKRVLYYQKQIDQIDQPGWKPTRLQLAQAILRHSDQDWLAYLVHKKQMKVHVFELDLEGRAVKLNVSKDLLADINDGTDAGLIEKVNQSLGNVSAEGRESRLGTALVQAVDQYRGGSLAGVIMFTDGVTTRDQTIASVSDYIRDKRVPLFFVGIGDEQDVRDLKLQDLKVADEVFVGDLLIFEARIVGKGYKDLDVPVLLKIREKDGKEKELTRTRVKINPKGDPVRFVLKHVPKEVGKKHFIIEVEQPKADKDDPGIKPTNLRLERTIDVIETKLIRVLYVEGQPRYEFRYLKFMMEQQRPEAKGEAKKRMLEMKVVLFDADRQFDKIDETVLENNAFPGTLDELAKFNVVVLGDVSPAELTPNNMKNLAAFVRGGLGKGEKGGGGLLFIAGSQFNPHSFKGTPLEDVLPIIPLAQPVEPENREEKLRLDVSPAGWQNPIFRFTPNNNENASIMQRFAPMYFFSRGYKLQDRAEILAFHPTAKADAPNPGKDQRLPLIVHHSYGLGRAMFFGFDETWRWRFRTDEKYYNQFWLQTFRYLGRGPSNRTLLRLDKQTPYRMDEPIQVTVSFPENSPLLRDPKKQPGEEPDVKVQVEFLPLDGDKDKGQKPKEIKLTRASDIKGTFQATFDRTQEGKYRFKLTTPDLSGAQDIPLAEAIVVVPPGELDHLRMNKQELEKAAADTGGEFFTILTADTLLEKLPPGFRVPLNTPHRPVLLWNHWMLFSYGVFLLTSLWLLRKMKHML